MSIVTYGNITYDIIEEIKNNNLYFIYSCCQNSETKEYVVIEKINKEKFRDELSKLPINDINKTFEEYVKAYEKDINLLKETSSPNILKGIDFIDRDNEFIIIKEYADINLKDYIKKEKKKGISPKEIRYIFNQLNNALEIFRNKKNIHTCLSSENIFLQYKDHGLMTDDYTVKMADFGNIIKLEVKSKFQLNIRQKIPFMAPELFTSYDENIKINEKCDLWSLGVLLYFLRFNELPFESELYKTYKILPDPQDPLLKDLINRLLEVDPNKRMSWGQYFKHKFFDVPDEEKKERNIKRLRFREKTIKVKKVLPGLDNKEKLGKNGKMTITYDNGDKYDGEFVDNVKEGRGVYYYGNGDKYEGEFFDDVKDGFGIYYYKNGERYEGDFKNDKKDGHGIYYYLDGDRYEGEFKEGFAEGRGTYYYQDGEKYIGDYKEDKRNGHGIYFYLNGDKYIGEFKDGKKDGKGILYKKDGNKKKELYFENGERIKFSPDLIDDELKEKNSKNISLTEEITKKKLNGKGIKIYPNEGKYEGEFVNGLKQGKGIYYFDDGDKYIGDFYNDDKQGKGVYYFKEGDKYEGEFHHNVKHGKGIYYYDNGDKFEGRFIDGMAEGKGKFFYNNGDRFEGRYKHDKRNGHGIYYYRNGTRYDGDFKNGEKNGNGIIVKSNGDYYEVKYKNNELIEKGPKFKDYDSFLKIRKIQETDTDCVEKYVGDIVNAKKNGKGIIIYKNGDKYEGDFKDNLKDGFGKYQYKNGDIYEGHFKYDLKEGKGTYIYNEGEKYEGDFHLDKKHGKGIYYYDNGDRYDGEFLMGVAHGKGIYYYKDGSKYEGEYANDLKDGNGVFIDKNGEKYKGEYKEGKMEGKGQIIYRDNSTFTGSFKDGKKNGFGKHIYLKEIIKKGKRMAEEK